MHITEKDRKRNELQIVLRYGTPEEVSKYIDNLPETETQTKNKHLTREQKIERIIELLEGGKQPCRI